MTYIGVVEDVLTLPGRSAPSSAAGEAIVYFDSVTNKLKVSENGGSFVDFGTPSLQQVYTNGGAGGGAILLTVSGGALALTAVAGISALTVAGGTQTASNPVISATQTWNNGAVTFTGQKLNVTNTASAAASLLTDWQVGGSSVFSVGVAGQTLITASVDVGLQISSTVGRSWFASSPGVTSGDFKSFTAISDSTALAAGVGGRLSLAGNVQAANQQTLVEFAASKDTATSNDRRAHLVVYINNNNGGGAQTALKALGISSTGEINAVSGGVFGIVSSTTDPTGTPDTAISRDSVSGSGFFDFGTGAANNKAGTLQFTNARLEGKATRYNAVNTTGWGVPAIYASGRSTAQAAAVASVATYTVGAADGSFDVSANVNVTASTTHSFTATVTYTDETSTSRTLTLTFSQLGGALVTSITQVTGTGPYSSVPFRIRCKSGTTITVATTGTFTSVAYNVEADIEQVS